MTGAIATMVARRSSFAAATAAASEVGKGRILIYDLAMEARMQRPARLGMTLAAALMMAACSASPPAGALPRLRGIPSDERPPWLRDLPAQLERHPAPQHWGGDNLASRRPGTHAERPGGAMLRSA